MSRCQGKNRDGTRCRNQVPEGEEYCHIHAGQPRPSSENLETLQTIIGQLSQLRAIRILVGLMLAAAFLGAALGSLGVLIVDGLLDARQMTAEESRVAQRATSAVAYEVTLTAVETLPPVKAMLDEEIRTDEWAFTISEVKRANWLLWNQRKLEPEGQWLILYGTARNITTHSGALFAGNFELRIPSLSGGINVHRNATGAAGLQAEIAQTVAGFMGVTLKAGETVPLVLAFDLPDVAEEATLRFVGTRLAISLGSVTQRPMLPTPGSGVTTTPAPTDSSTSTDTPNPTRTPRPTATSLWTPTRTATPVATSTPTGTSTPTPEPTLPGVVILTPCVRVRQGPGSNYDSLGAIELGTNLVLTARNEPGTWIWGRAAPGDLEGWMWAAGIATEGDVAILPVKETQ